jgi:hypothetical protein
MAGISNNYIDSFLRYVTNNYIGVFSANNLPKNLHKTETFSLICNHDKVGEAGSHFITIVHCGTCIMYIDSLGQPCPIDDIRNFLWSFQLPVFYNSRQLQPTNSSFCGFYCILYVLYFDKLFNSIVPPSRLIFNVKKLSSNDMLCIRQIKRLLK